MIYLSHGQGKPTETKNSIQTPFGAKTRTGTNFKPTGSGLLPEKDEDKMDEQKIYYTGREEGDYEDGRNIYWVSLCDTKDIIEEEGADVHTDCTGDMSTYGYPHPDYKDFDSIEDYVDCLNEKLYSKKELEEIHSLLDAIKENYDEDGEIKEEEAEDFFRFSKELERLFDLLDQQACYDSHVKLIKEAEEELGIKPSQIIVTVEGDKYSHPTGEEYIKMYSED